MKFKALLIMMTLLSALIFGQSPRPYTELDDSNFKFMLRGYFCAGSKIKDTQALGGFGSSGNFPKAVTAALNKAISRMGSWTLTSIELSKSWQSLWQARAP